MIATSSEDKMAADLLSMLQKNNGPEMEAMQIMTPAMTAFLESSRNVTAALVDNVRDYKRIGENKSEMVDSIINSKLSARGALATHLRMYAASGKWTIYAQNLHGKKVPIITIDTILVAITRLFRHIHDIEEFTPFKGHTTEQLVAAFQRYMVREAVSFQEAHVMDYEFDTLWKGQALAQKRLFSNPLYYHNHWMVFFTNKKSGASKLVDDIANAVEFRGKMIKLDHEVGRADRKTDKLVDATGAIQLASQENLKYDQQIRIMKGAAERHGGDLETLNKAELLNASRVKVTVPVDDEEEESPTIPTHIDISEMVNFIVAGETFDGGRVRKNKRRAATKSDTQTDSDVSESVDDVAPATRKRRVAKKALALAQKDTPADEELFGEIAMDMVNAEGGFDGIDFDTPDEEEEKESEGSLVLEPLPF